jgi:hypothetical protein
MRWILGALLVLGCATQQRPYKDVPVAVAVAAGTGSMAAGVATAVVVTAAVATVVVGAEQFPDPPAGTPDADAATKRLPDLCGSCECYGKGRGGSAKGTHRYPPGAGAEPYTRATCRQDCKDYEYTGFKCTGDKVITWFE